MVGAFSGLRLILHPDCFTVTYNVIYKTLEKKTFSKKNFGKVFFFWDKEKITCEPQELNFLKDIF